MTAMVVEGFVWKARLYVSKEGPWSWSVTDVVGISLKGAASSSFDSTDRNSALQGKLKKHTDNDNRWATDRYTGTAFFIIGVLNNY